MPNSPEVQITGSYPRLRQNYATLIPLSAFDPEALTTHHIIRRLPANQLSVLVTFLQIHLPFSLSCRYPNSFTPLKN